MPGENRRCFSLSPLPDEMAVQREAVRGMPSYGRNSSRTGDRPSPPCRTELELPHRTPSGCGTPVHREVAEISAPFVAYDNQADCRTLGSGMPLRSVRRSCRASSTAEGDDQNRPGLGAAGIPPRYNGAGRIVLRDPLLSLFFAKFYPTVTNPSCSGCITPGSSSVGKLARRVPLRRQAQALPDERSASGSAQS